MTTKTIIISLIIVVAICVVVFEYFHKKHAKYTEDELKQFTIDLLRKGVESIAYDQYIAAVKRHYNISQKAATALVGKAQKHNIVALSNHQVTLAG